MIFIKYPGNVATCHVTFRFLLRRALRAEIPVPRQLVTRRCDGCSATSALLGCSRSQSESVFRLTVSATSQSARRGAETYDYGEDEDDGDEDDKAKLLQEEHDREVAEALDAKFLQEQHDREVGEAVMAEWRDEYGEANTENFD